MPGPFLLRLMMLIVALTGMNLVVRPSQKKYRPLAEVLQPPFGVYSGIW